MATLTSPRGGLTDQEKAELVAWKHQMAERDRAMEPERNADAVLAELQVSLGTFARMREAAYSARQDARQALKRNPKSFDARQWLAIAEGDILGSEGQIRSAKTAIKEWSKVAERQRSAREARRERERRLDEAERKLKGLGVGLS